MAKEKVKFIFKDESKKELFSFGSKTATKEFGKLQQGTRLKLFIDEGKDFGEQYTGDYEVKGLPEGPDTPPEPPVICPEGQHSENGVCVPDVEPPPDHTCGQGQHWDSASGKCVDNETPPPPPTDEVLFDSHIHSKLHDGQVRTITQEGSISPNGLGVECRASGSPHIQVNDDGTFSLLDDDLGRFYGYVCNYDATMEIECAFWNGGKQTLSLKTRSRHNEGGSPENRFGGYGFAVKADSWDAKREDYHNVHTSMGSGKLPGIKVQEYFKVEFTVKDEGSGVRQIGKVNGSKVFDKLDSSPKAYMQDKASFEKQSYYWVRQNTTSLTEIRIKSLRILKA